MTHPQPTQPARPPRPHEVTAAEDVLARTEQLRRVARRDTRGLEIPLLVLGVLTLGYAAVSHVEQNVLYSDLGPGQSRDSTDAELWFSQFADNYWAVVGGAGLLVIGLWFAVRSRRRGAGAGAGAWIAGGVGLLLIATFGLPFSAWGMVGMFGIVGFMAPTAFIGIALLLIARRRRDRRLAVWVVVFCVVVTLAHLGFFTNRFSDLLRLVGPGDAVPVHAVVQADLVVMAVLGLVLIGVGLRGRRAGGTASRHEPVAS
ncbi:hypothetical protein [Intrasporangium flavum]|uniref:hypothetical protein n=1 Tax=Intrasporangium flavum TaxID=1428657 RepID=UPI00096E55E9|nr:hypothetical protein [Intrasporangium flavum]